MSECRVVRDDEADIIAAVRALSERYDYVSPPAALARPMTTSPARRKAFGAKVIRHPEAVRRLIAL